MPHEPASRRHGATLVRPHPEDDVAAVRAAVNRTRVPYGQRPRPRTAADRWWDFVSRYGWRAYALPVLAVVTVAALLSSTSPSAPTRPKDVAARRSAPVAGPKSAGPSMAPSSIALKNDDPGANADTAVLKAGALPAGGAYTVKGNGTFRVLKGTSKKVGTGQLFRYSIEVENGVSGIDTTQFEQLVMSTLADPRSWAAHGVALQRVDSGPIDFHISMTSVMTVRKYCGYDIPVETSCYASAAQAGVNRVVFNVARWERGASAYLGDLAAYRVYMINHEDGHALGHNHAHQCLPGGLAPVMMQQTFGLKSAATGKQCGANPWPYPTGAAGAPGAEQVDTASNDEYGR